MLVEKESSCPVKLVPSQLNDKPEARLDSSEVEAHPPVKMLDLEISGTSALGSLAQLETMEITSSPAQYSEQLELLLQMGENGLEGSKDAAELMEDPVGHDKSSMEIITDCDSENSGLNIICLEECLAEESEEERNKNMELDIIDAVIKNRQEAEIVQDQILDGNIEALRASFLEQEHTWSLNKSRAELLMKIGLNEIKTLAEESLAHIKEIEDKPILSQRMLLYFGSAGEQQSLLYRQVWEPFTDE